MRLTVLAIRYTLLALMVIGLTPTVTSAEEPRVESVVASEQALFFSCCLISVEAAEIEAVCELLSNREMASRSEDVSLLGISDGHRAVENVLQHKGVKRLSAVKIRATAGQPATIHSGGLTFLAKGADENGETIAEEIELGTRIELTPEADDVWQISMQYREGTTEAEHPAISTVRTQFTADFRSCQTWVSVLPAGKDGRRVIAVVTREKCDAIPSPVSR